MAQTLHGIYESGGGRMAYVFHVLGYPWAVCTDPALISAAEILGAGYEDHDAAARYLRRKIFGPAHWTVSASEYYPADTAPMFATLLFSSLGAESWRIDQASGMLSSSGWSVEILDDDLSVTWPHKASGDEIWGLEGLHRVVDLDESGSAGWGELDASLMRRLVDGETRPSSFDMIEQSGGRLSARLTALGANDHMMLWVEHECIAVNDVTVADADRPEELEVDIADAGAGRGLYGSRIADHLYRPSLSYRPIISDVPGSIAGEYCRLWQIPLDETGALVLDVDGDPIVAEQRCGVVSTNISTRKNVTSIDVLPFTDSFKIDVERQQLAKSYESHLQRYVLCRGVDSGDDAESITKYQQCPHLILQEWRPNVTLGTDGGYSDPVPIWLCEPGEVVVFESKEEIFNAIMNKINSLDHPGQIYWEYNLSSITGGTLYHKTGRADNDTRRAKHVTESSGTRFALDRESLTRVTGPLAFVLGICDWDPDSYDESENQTQNGFFNLIRNNTNKLIFDMEYVSHKMGGTRDDVWLLANDGTLSSLGAFNREVFSSNYYYQWDWINHHPGPDNGSNDTYHDIMTAGSFSLPDDGTSEPVIYVNSDEEIEIGETLNVGKNLYCTIESKDDGIVDIVDDKLLAEEQIPYGMSLFHIPASMVDNLDEEYDAETNIYTLDPPVIDSFVITKRIDLVTNIGNIFRALLGDETLLNISIAPEMSSSFNPFGVTIGDEGMVSRIDWLSMDEIIHPYDYHYYSYVLSTEDSLYNCIKAELQLHCSYMVLDWDYTNLQWTIKFNSIGPLNKSLAFMSGRNLDESINVPGIPSESHNSTQIINAIELTSNLDAVTINGAATTSIKMDNRISKIKPSLSKFTVPFNLGDIFMSDAHRKLLNRFRDALRNLSRPRVSQSRKLTCIGAFKAFPGLESLITDVSARVPMTHRLGLEDQPVLITERSHDLSKEVIDITYTIGGKSSWGWAPACKILAENMTISSGHWTAYPNNHEYTFTTDAKDLWYFDCFDVRIPSAPVARNCSCDDYAVFAVELGSRGFTPLPFTCKILIDGEGDPYLYLAGTTTGLSEGKNYALYFADYDDCQPCQKRWVFGADKNNLVGDDGDNPSKWV
jgi:hypothetical protein